MTYPTHTKKSGLANRVFKIQKHLCAVLTK